MATALGAVVLAIMSSIGLFTGPQELPPPLQERISKAVQGLEDTGVLITEMEENLERLRNVNQELTQEQLELQDWLSVKEHQDTLRPYIESLSQASLWEQRKVTVGTTVIGIIGGWLLGFTTPTIKEFVGGLRRPRSSKSEEHPE